MDEADDSLWAAVCGGDEEAFAVVFRRHCDAVHTQCARRAGSYDAADDLLSAVFMQAWRSRDKVRFLDGSMRAWLMVVASNVTATHLRARRRYDAMTHRLLDEAQHAMSQVEESPESRLDALTLAPLLAAALSSLNAREQEVVALCDLAEYPYGEVAAVLGVPMGTVKSRLSRAHQKLRGLLGDRVSAALGLNPTTNPLQEVQG